MSKVLFHSLLILLTSAVSHLAEAQPTKKVPRLGYLVAGSSSSEARRLKAFREGLSQLGYAEGQNIIIEYRYGDGRPARLPELAAISFVLMLTLLLPVAFQFARQRMPPIRYLLSWRSVPTP